MSQNLRLDPRQKRFAELIHQGITPHAAYPQAGYAPNRWNPYRMVKRPRIQAYVRKLEERALKKYDITIDKLVTDLEAAKNLAMNGGQPSAAVNAVMAQAKLCGLDITKVEHKNVSEMDRAELIKAAKEQLGADGEALVNKLLAERQEATEAWPAFSPTGTVQ